MPRKSDGSLGLNEGDLAAVLGELADYFSKTLQEANSQLRRSVKLWGRENFAFQANKVELKRRLKALWNRGQSSPSEGADE